MTALSSHRRAALAADHQRTKRARAFRLLAVESQGKREGPQPVFIGKDKRGVDTLTIGGHPVGNTVLAGSVGIRHEWDEPKYRFVELTLMVRDLRVDDGHEKHTFIDGRETVEDTKEA